MVRRYYQLPSLTSLAVFESSARHLNFTRAASELNVTRGAVSRQIKALEDEVGVPLFNRDSEGILLTPEGEDLYAVLARGFSEASEALQRIRAGQRQEQVTLACSNAFASLWLMPRIGAFWRSYPKIVVDHLISDDARQLRQAAVNLRIRYGMGDWPDENAQLLFSDRIFLVCGPGYAEGRETDRNIEALDLLHVDDVDPDWTGWDEFLRRADVEHGPLLGRRFNNFSVLLQATQDDQGVALGWERLIWNLVAEGKLKRFGTLEVEAPGAYYLTWNRNHTLSPAAETLKDWLIETAEAFARDHPLGGAGVTPGDT